MTSTPPWLLTATKRTPIIYMVLQLIWKNMHFVNAINRRIISTLPTILYSL